MNFDQILIELGRALVELFLILRGNSHGIFQGTHEAAIFEAQGGQIGPGGFSHLDDLRRTAAAIQTRQDALNLALNRLNGIDSAVGSRVKEVCQPLLRQSGELLNTARQTESAAASLQQTDPTRFQGVVLGQGGLGPEIGRTTNALVSTQLNQQARQLTQRGIEPRLIPAARTALQGVVTQIRNLPLDAKEAVRNLTATLVAMRTLLTVFARQALLAGRVALAAALASIEQALVAIGSRLTTPILILNLGQLFKQAAGRGSDDAT
jgi:hypothetical protein